jgi:hypothetical protein
MATRLSVAVLLVALFTACSTPHVVRLDTGQGAPLEYRPPTSEDEFNAFKALFGR